MWISGSGGSGRSLTKNHICSMIPFASLKGLELHQSLEMMGYAGNIDLMRQPVHFFGDLLGSGECLRGLASAFK